MSDHNNESYEPEQFVGASSGSRATCGKEWSDSDTIKLSEAYKEVHAVEKSSPSPR
jgi:hypothetical protein